MPAAEELRTVTATRYVTPLREGGSLPGLLEADDDGLYVVKFTGAGQGTRALLAEVIVGELARAIGLPVPEQVIVEVDPALGSPARPRDPGAADRESRGEPRSRLPPRRRRLPARGRLGGSIRSSRRTSSGWTRSPPTLIERHAIPTS